MTEQRIYSAETTSGMRPAVQDLWEGLKLAPVWQAFAWDEVQNRYRRSAFGIAWIAITYLLFVLAISVFFGGFSSKDSFEFVHYIAIGYAIFMFMMGNLTDGCVVFTNAASWIKSAPLPYSVHVYKSIARSLMPLGIHLLGAFVIMVPTGWRPTWEIVLALPAFAILLVNAVWIQLALGFVASRFRDVTHLIAAIQRFMFFSTPILWVFEERTGLAKDVATVNPLTHYIAIVRDPVLGNVPDVTSWAYVLLLTLCGWLIALLLSSNMRHRLPFWV